VFEEGPFVAMGGQAETITTGLEQDWREGMTLSQVLTVAVALLAKDPSGAERTLTPDQLEVAVLDRQRPRRAFRRLAGPLLARLLSPDDPVHDVPHTDEPGPGLHDTLSRVDENGVPAPGSSQADDRRGGPAGEAEPSTPRSEEDGDS
jgi:proteasome alpha subunit